MANGSTVFVDTNVLLYALDPRDPVKRGAAGTWLARCWGDRSGRVSTQILNELYVNLRRVAPAYDADAARQQVRRYRAWSPWPVDDSTVDIAWKLEERMAIGYRDALVIAAAQQQGCAYLLTEDLQDGRVFDELTILNPFTADVTLLDSPV